MRKVRNILEYYYFRVKWWAKGLTGGLWVDIDPKDNSVTLSPRLIGEANLMKQLPILMFREGERFGFVVNPDQLSEDDVEKDTKTVQYNTKYKTCGFESPVVQQLVNAYYPCIKNPSLKRLKVVIECMEMEGKIVKLFYIVKE